MLKRKIFISFLLFFVAFTAKAELINIGILDKQAVTSFIFYPQEGKYVVYTESGKLLDIDNTEIIEISYRNQKVFLKTLDKDYGYFNKIRIIGVSNKNAFKLKTNKPVGKIIQYEDNLFVKAHPFHSYLQLINNINIDNYVAGVVEAEVGKSPPEEYFKLQAIICRTYALKNINKHQTEGFSLCDKVHCQAYHGKPKSEQIKQSALLTSNTVIVDSDINLITATFYSNCGGQSANSEEVWHQELYYLRSVKDSFCLSENNSNWQKKIAKNEWANYLINNGYPKEILNDSCDYEYFQIGRERFFEKQNVQIPFVKLRTDWKLKSAQFDVKTEGNFVVLQGKGFGHGVGLCQEGAMRMAKMGYTYAEILHFYYEDVHMVDLESLDFFKAEF